MTLEEAILQIQNVGNFGENWPGLFTKLIEGKLAVETAIDLKTKQNKYQTVCVAYLDPDLSNLIMRDISETGEIWIN